MIVDPTFAWPLLLIVILGILVAICATLLPSRRLPLQVEITKEEPPPPPDPEVPDLLLNQLRTNSGAEGTNEVVLPSQQEALEEIIDLTFKQGKSTYAWQDEQGFWHVRS